MKYKNIIHITGNDNFQIEGDFKGLIRIFGEKHEKMNTEIFSLEKPETIDTSTFLSIGLFSEKRLFAFRGSDKKKRNKEETKSLENFITQLDSLSQQLSADTILIFAFLGPAEKKLTTWLKKHATLREKKFSWENLSNTQTSLPRSEVQKIIQLYKKHESFRDKYSHDPWISYEVIHTIEMAEILYENNIALDAEILEQITHAYEGGAIFDFIDSILAGNIQESLKKLQRFYHQDNFYIFFAGLISNLRNSLYIITLRDLGASVQNIKENLQIHPFVVQKSYRSPLSQKEISSFFKKIITKKIAYQSGFGMKKSELGLFFEIELALLNLKK